MRVFLGIIFISSICFFSSHTWADDVYFEIGAGASDIIGGASSLGTGATSNLSLGLGGNFMFGYNFNHAGNTLQFHAGLKNRFSTGSNTAGSYFMNSIYPVLRLELPRVYFGIGLTPYIYTRRGGLGFDNYQLLFGAIGYFAEVGLLWRVVPYWHCSLEFSGYMVNTSTGFSPSLALDGSFNMRFFLYNESGSSGTGGSSGGGRKYDGWRYPFGIEIGH